MKRRRVALTVGATALLLTTAVPAEAAGSAPNCCGAPSTWAPGDKTFLGRALNAANPVWFTGSDGILTEAFYPNPDTPNLTDQQFVVGDAAHTWNQTEKTEATHTVTRTSPNALAWTVTNTGSNGKWKITKTIYTDPASPVINQRVTFTALQGTLGDFTLYQLSNPSHQGKGDNDTGKTVTHNGRQMLVSSGPGGAPASAIAVGNGLGWLNQNGAPMLSSGYVGANDGWQDLLGGTNPDHTMSYTYDQATNGNVAQFGQLDLGPVAGQTSVTFDLALSMGPDENAAQSTVDSELGKLAAAPNGVLDSYTAQWSDWVSKLNGYDGVGGQQYTLSAMALKASQDPGTGAIVAGLGHPWGDTARTGDPGYNRAWARDLYNAATGLLLAGDTDGAVAATRFLFERQQQSDGHFPQNSLVDGTPSWTGVQLDQTAYPIVLAWQLRDKAPDLVGSSYYANHIRPAANYVMSHGPRTDQERWEENGGYSPSTIAAEIAGLYLASKIAAQNGDSGNASAYQAKADDWAANVAGWTYTTSGPFGGHEYFLRITPNGNPNDNATVNVANGGGSYNQNSVVDNGFLQLVLLGILPANDLRVANSTAVTANPAAGQSAGSLVETLPNGIGFYRYNHDGYGETASGGNWTGAGIGRLWPLLGAEFGQYRSLLGDDVTPYLRDLRNFATPAGLLPEQVWNKAAPSGATPGTPTNSMCALNWALSTDIQLTAAKYAQQHGDSRLPGMPADVYAHYAGAAKPPVTTSPSPAIAGAPVTVRYTGSLAASASALTMHWGHDGWQGVTDTPMAKQADGSWTATVTVPSGTGINTAYVNQSGAWDNNGGADHDIGATGAALPR